MKISTTTLIAITMLTAFNVNANKSTIHKECIDEPIFNGSACVYQANKAAKKTIILVHGLNGSALRDWRYQIPVLSKDYHVLTFDLPGFGDSDKEVAYYSPREYAKFINYIANRYAHGKAIVVGHSMGGAISLRYSEMFPQNIENLILVDVAGVLHRMAYSRQLMKGWLKTRVSDDSRMLYHADRLANKLLSKVEPVVGPLSSFMSQYVLKSEVLDIDSTTTSAVTLAHEDLTDALSLLQIPTMIIWGENDTIAPMRTAQVLKSYLPQASLKIIKNAAHVPMVDQPYKFNKLMESYLRKSDSDDYKITKTRTTKNEEEGSGRSVTCEDKVDKIYEGDYEDLDIINCNQVVIRNANINNLVIRSSSVSIENSEIISTQTAMDVGQSDVVITASRLIGETAIMLSGSQLDMAGVTLIGEDFSVNGDESSSLLVFSVSMIDSQYDTRAIHEFVKVDRENPL
jgi:pimeloyl-ACP methyl ester carboxylesterase